MSRYLPIMCWFRIFSALISLSVGKYVELCALKCQISSKSNTLRFLLLIIYAHNVPDLRTYTCVKPWYLDDLEQNSDLQEGSIWAFFDDLRTVLIGRRAPKWAVAICWPTCRHVCALVSHMGTYAHDPSHACIMRKADSKGRLIGWPAETRTHWRPRAQRDRLATCNHACGSCRG